MQNLEKQLAQTKQSSRILNTMQDSQRNANLQTQNAHCRIYILQKGKTMQNLEKQLAQTKQSSRILNTMQDSQRNAVLLSMAEALESQSEYICQENAKDLQLASALPQAMQKRLELNHSKILAMAQGIRDIVKIYN